MAESEKGLELWKAANQGNDDLVKTLLDEKVDVNWVNMDSNGEDSVLHTAVTKGWKGTS